jgi:hypothetical protein
MGSKGCIVAAVAVVLIISGIISVLGADPESNSPIKETSYSPDSYPLESPSALNISSFKSPLMADIKQLETTDVWEKYNLVSVELCSGICCVE